MCFAGCIDFNKFVIGTAEYIRRNNGSIILEDHSDEKHRAPRWDAQADLERGCKKFGSKVSYHAFCMDYLFVPLSQRISSMLIEGGEVPKHLTHAVTLSSKHC